MSAIILAGTIFVTTVGGILLGALFRRALPRDHLNEHAKDVVRLCGRGSRNVNTWHGKIGTSAEA